MANAALLGLKLRLFDLLMPLDALAFSHGQTEILDPGWLHVPPNNKMLSSCQGPIYPGEFRPDLHLDCPRSGSYPFARKVLAWTPRIAPGIFPTSVAKGTLACLAPWQAADQTIATCLDPAHGRWR